MENNFVTVSRILHAGYEIKTSRAHILFDPIFENPFSRNCHAYPNVEFDTNQIKKLKPDAIFISHHHDDHCSFESLNLLNRDIPIYMFCVHEEMFSLLRELGFKNVYSLTLDESVVLADLEVIARRALDHDVDCLFQVRSNGLNILNVVDSWIDEDTLELLKKQGPWDLICWPFQTMREVEVLSPKRFKTEPQSLPEEWLAQLKELNPRIIIPSSCQFQMEPWSWYNEAFFPITYQQFNKEVLAVIPKAQIQRLNPGESLALSQNGLTKSERLQWVKPIGEQNGDYTYNLKVIPQSTSEIAKHFTALSKSEVDLVSKFCTDDILKKFNDLGPSADAYFIKSRIWQLSLFDHNGYEKKYFYELKEENIKLLNEVPTKVDWFTEVPTQKLYAALKLGESLTSMYVRTACENEDVEILEDPLVRCLFSGLCDDGFASYQKAQLKSIKSKT
jgi:L-ascorbate metabolism protein UlaG (beta-lactamase superfamily)